MPGRPSDGIGGPSAQGDRIGKSAGRKPEARRDAESTDEANRLRLCCQEKLLSVEGRGSVPQTDTGRRVEKTKVRGRNHVKELGKIAP